MVTRKKTAPAPVVEEQPVEAVEYVEDENWTGDTDGGEDTPKKRRGRTVSPLIVATRNYEAAHKAADKARAAMAKVKPLADAVEEAEKAESMAFEALQSELGKLSS